MTALARAWAGLLRLLMAAAAVYIGAILVLIVYVTVCRTAGWAYESASFVVIEYGFVYILFLGSPWLVRQRGHVYIEMLTAALPPRRRAALSRLIAAVAAATCLLWAWYSGKLAYLDMVGIVYDELRGQYDLKRWIITSAFPAGFFLMGVEFLRFVFTRDPMHGGIAGIASERAEIEQQQAFAAGRR